MKTVISILLLIASLSLNGQRWSNFGSKKTDIAYAYYFDSTSNNLFIGGRFDTLQGIAAHNIIRWDGVNWFPMGFGFNKFVNVITKYNGEIYAAGEFDSSGTTAFKQPIAKWDGTQWLPLDTIHQFNTNQAGFLWAIHDLVEWNGSLIAAGNFNCFQNNLNARSITRWNGINWFAMAPLYCDLYSPARTSLSVFQNVLYIGVGVGGAIDSCTSAGQPSSNVWAFMKYEPVCSTFVEVGGGLWPMGSGVNDILNYNGSLYLALPVFPPWAGNFITRYDGINFFPLSDGLNYDVETLTEYQGQLVAAGRFTADGTNTQVLRHVAVWDGSSWNPLPGGCDLNSWVYKIFGHDSLLFAFTLSDSCGSTPINYSAVYPNTVTGLQELLSKEENRINVFPNPANQQFTVKIPEFVKSNKNEIIINDITGREIYRIILQNTETVINVEAWKPGLYISKFLENKQIIAASKIIINR